MEDIYMDTFYTDIDDLSEKEKLILEAACKIFSAKGFSAATTNEIAKEAGVAEGTIFRYFKTKKDILRGLFIQIANIIVDKMVLPSLEKILTDTSRKNTREIIREIIADRIKAVDVYFPMMKVVISEILFHEDIRALFVDKIVNRLIPVFDEFYLRKVAEGELRPVKTNSAMRAFVGNIMIFIIQKNVFADKLPIDDLDEEIESLIDVLLFGISNHTKY
jgi:AcrR family transcriptional regulator